MNDQTRRPSFFPKKILVSTDGSENAKRAVGAAIVLAKQFNSEIFVVTVMAVVIPHSYSPMGATMTPADYSQFFDMAEKEGTKVVDDALEMAKRESVVKVRGKVLTTVGSVPEAILDAATKDNSDLIVVGTRGLGGFKKLLLGSVSSAIVTNANCTVLVVR
jgi:nucleotide-binding universal stress UspA family protein